MSKELGPVKIELTLAGDVTVNELEEINKALKKIKWLIKDIKVYGDKKYTALMKRATIKKLKL